MKKFAVYCLLFALLLTGCGKKDPIPGTPAEPDPQPPAVDTPAAPPEEPVPVQGPLSNLPEGTTVALAEIEAPQPQPAPPTSWQVGDDLVELWEGSLLVGDRVLLQGAYDELDPLNIRVYEVETVLDDHRFFYSCIGYDHVWGYGIYDLRTDTDTPLVVDSPFADSLIVEKVVGDRALMLYTTGPEFGYFLLELNEDFPMTPLPVGYTTEAEGLMGTSLISDDLMVMAFLENTSEEYRFKVVETATGRVLLDWTTPRGDIIDSPELGLEDVLLVSVRKDNDLWIYRVPYAAPQGPLVDPPLGAQIGLENAVSRISLTSGDLTLRLPLPVTETVFLALGGDGVQSYLVSCSARTGEILHQAPVETFDGQWELVYSGDGARFYNGQEYWQITLNEAHQLTMEQVDDGGRLVRMGDHVLDKGRDGSLLIDGKPVLSGEYLDFSVLAVVDDHRLLYRQYNSGTGNSSDGLYDHRTGESRLLTFIGQQVWGLWQDTVLIGQQGSESAWSLSVFDLAAMESTSLGISCTPEDQLVGNREGTRLAIRRGQDVTVYDLTDGSSLFTWTVPDQSGWQVWPAGQRTIMAWKGTVLWTAEY